MKPSFNDDDDIKGLSDSARLLYALLWGHMDRNGVIEDSVQSIRSKVYPREDRSIAVVAGYLAELLSAGPSGRPRLYRFQWRGRAYLYAPTMPRHQKIYSDEPAVIPMTPAEFARVVDEFEKSDSLPQPGTVTDAVHPPEQKVDGERLSTGGPTEQARAFSSASASYLSSASASASGVQNGIGDKSTDSPENGDAGEGGCALSDSVTDVIDQTIARGRYSTAVKLIRPNRGLRERYREFLAKHDPGGTDAEGTA